MAVSPNLYTRTVKSSNLIPDTNLCVSRPACEHKLNNDKHDELFDGYTDNEIHQFIGRLDIDKIYIDSLITTFNYVSRYVRAGRVLSMKSPLSSGEEKIRGLICNLIERKNQTDIEMFLSACTDYCCELSDMHQISLIKNNLLEIRSETFQDCILDIKKRIREMGVNHDTVIDTSLIVRVKDHCDELVKRLIMNVIDESLEKEKLKKMNA